MKKFGFTLAEVLITLGVIGIVAAITIPNIMTGYQKKVQVASLQRAYNEVQNGIVKYMADNNLEKLSESELTYNRSGVYSFFNTYLKPINYSTNWYDYFTSYGNIGGSDNGHGAPNYFPFQGTRYCGKLRSGASVCIAPYSTAYNRMLVNVDTNGKDKPNIIGRDYFAFFIYNDGTVGASESSQYLGHTSYSSSICVNPVDCFGKVMSDGWVMNY